MSQIPNIRSFGAGQFRQVGSQQQYGPIPYQQVSAQQPSFGSRMNPTQQAFGQYRDVLFGEIQTQQRLADRQHNYLRGIENEFRGAIQQGMQSAVDTAEDAAGRLQDVGQRDLNEIRSRVQQTERNFEDTTARNVQTQTFGAQRDINNQIDAIRSDPNIPESIKQQQIRDLETSRREILSQSLASVGANYANQRAQLETAGTGLLGEAMQRRAGYETTAAQARLAGQEMMFNYASQYPALGQMAASNPPPFVSTFAGLLTLSELAMSAQTSGAGAAAITAPFGINPNQGGGARSYRRIGGFNPGGY